jgi:hypothetical protein
MVNSYSISIGPITVTNSDSVSCIFSSKEASSSVSAILFYFIKIVHKMHEKHEVYDKLS